MDSDTGLLLPGEDHQAEDQLTGGCDEAFQTPQVHRFSAFKQIDKYHFKRKKYFAADIQKKDLSPVR
jgi:hypothetical protein